MATATPITKQEFEDFVLPLGFVPVKIEGTKELVYGKIVQHTTHKLSLRVYSSINPDGHSRAVGADAIRVALFARKKNQQITMVGGDRRVHRVVGWRTNLKTRLDKWPEQLGPNCPLCDSPTVYREPDKGKKWKPFYGCSEYPVCKGSMPDLATFLDNK